MRAPDPARIAVDWLRGLGEFTLLTREAFLSMFQRRPDVSSIIYQLYFIGVKSQFVGLINGSLTGMAFAAQTYFQFHPVRMSTATLPQGGVGHCSEYGPGLTGR